MPLRLLRLVVVPGRACFRIGHLALVFDRNCGSAVKGTSPPPSQYPRLADRTLGRATKAAMGFPTIPGPVFTDNFEDPLLDYVLPRLVPSPNGDGNEIAGVPSALHRCHSAPIWDGT